MPEITAHGAETAEKIMKTALMVFAEFGFAGARMDEIARRAKVNKATIYYHIGGKQKLYESVLQRIFSELTRGLREALNTLVEPEEKLRFYIRNLFQLMVRYPELPPIILRESASKVKNLPVEVIHEITVMIKTLGIILEEGMSQNRFVPVSAFVIHMMIIAPLVMYIAGKPLRKRISREAPELGIPGGDLEDEFILEIERHIFSAVMKEPVPPEENRT